MFAEPLHVGRPNLGARESLYRLIDEMLDQRWLTNNGPLVRQFEERLAGLLGVRNVVAVVNATVGLEIAMRALDLHGEVIVPSFTFIATAHILQWLNLTPVFSDIDPQTHNLDPRRVEALINPRTTAILGVHLWGRPCEVEALQAIADRNGLKLIFDAAHAFGCSRQGKSIGGFGACEVFSFHATKFFNTFEGGAITTDDDGLADRLRLMRNFGFTGYDRVASIGVNGKMNEVCAAMGLTNLDSLDQFIQTNRENYFAYQTVLAGLPGVSLIDYDPLERNNYQYIVLEIDEQAAGLKRDAILQILHAEKILARRYFYPGCHRMEPYRTLVPNAGADLPITESLSERVLSLPNGTSLGPEEVDQIGRLLGWLIEYSGPINDRLTALGEGATYAGR